MNITDQRGSFTAEQLRQKYNLDGLTKDRKAIQQNENQIIKLNNEQNQIVEAIILSLNGIEIQSEITLWFFNAIPTLENSPAIGWTDDETKNEHIGDLYYNKDTGYVYQFQLNDEVYEWIKQTNTNLIQAMAITNASIDTNDNHRRVFLDSPIPPYSNGDWYILSNGDLKICQISKNSEEGYEEKDFIIASKYVIGTQAQEMNNKIIVTAGQVTIITQEVDEINEKIEDNRYYIDENNEKHLISSKVLDISKTVDGVNYKISQIGGSNLIEDSRATYNNEKWNKVLKSYIDTDTRQNTDSKYVIFLEDYESDNPKQIIQTQNGIHAVGFKYKKLIPLANTKIKINGYEIVLDSEEWKEENYSFEVLSNTIEIELISDTDDSCYVGDLVCRRNAIAGIWDTANGESIYGNTKIYDGVETEDHEKRTTLKPDGLRGYNKTTGELKFETTTKGAKGDHAEFNSSKIAGILRQKVGNQVWDTWVG